MQGWQPGLPKLLYRFLALKREDMLIKRYIALISRF